MARYSLEDIPPVTTPRRSGNKKKHSWETEEEYQERIAKYTPEYVSQVEKENKIKLENDRKALEEYNNSEEGKSRTKLVQEQDNAFFENMKVHSKNDSSFREQYSKVSKAVQNKIDTTKIGNAITNAAKDKENERLEKWRHYKNLTDATITATELALSGGSLLGAYANYKNWANAANVTKRTIANLLQKAQLPMQVGGLGIDGIQTVGGIINNAPFETYYNGGSSLLGVAGSLGAADLFPDRVDRVLDVLGIIQNTGDFIKFGYDFYNNNK